MLMSMVMTSKMRTAIIIKMPSACADDDVYDGAAVDDADGAGDDVSDDGAEAIDEAGVDDGHRMSMIMLMQAIPCVINKVPASGAGLPGQPR